MQIKLSRIYSKFAIMTMCLIANLCSYADAWDQDSIQKAFSGRILEPVEGVWQFPDDGARLLIIKSTATTFDIILLDSPRLDIRPGITIGKAKVTPTSLTYDAQLNSNPLGDKSLRKSNTRISVTKDDMLKFSPYSQGMSVSFRRWIPYFFRVTITKSTRPDGLSGAVRIFPQVTSDYKPCL